LSFGSLCIIYSLPPFFGVSEGNGVFMIRLHNFCL
jgi:hypothetical protein